MLNLLFGSFRGARTPSRRSSRRPIPTRRVTPRLEALEDRLAPAAVNWVGTLGGGDGSSWLDQKNWSTGTLPDAGDDVTIAPPSGNTQVHLLTDSTSTSVRSLTISGGSNGTVNALDLDQGTLTILGDPNIPTDSRVNANGVLQTCGNVTLSSNVTLHIAGKLEWGDSTFAGGTLQNESTGTIDWTTSYESGNTPFAQKVFSGLTFNNYGQINWKDGSINVMNGSVFTNESGAAITIADYALNLPPQNQNTSSGGVVAMQETYFGALSRFINYGTVTQTSSLPPQLNTNPQNDAGTTFALELDNQAGGVLDVEQGMLAVEWGTSVGTFNEAAGATLEFFGQNTYVYYLPSGASNTGTGTLYINGGAGGFEVDTNISLGNLNDGGTLRGSGTVTVTGALTWNGTMSGTGDRTAQGAPYGQTIVQGSTTVAGRSFLTNHRTLSLYGTITWNTGVQVSTDGGGVLNNYGTLTTTGSGGSFGPDDGAGSQFNNFGTVIQTGTSSSFTVDGSFTNNGTVDVRTGTITLTTLTNFSASSSTLQGGTYLLTGILQINNCSQDVTTNAATLTLNGAGSRIFNGSGSSALLHLAANTGTFTVTGGRAFTPSSASGGNLTFQNSGTLNVNGGTLSISSGSGTLSMTGGILEGAGEIDANVSIAGGTVLPGETSGHGSSSSSAYRFGILTINGNFIFGYNATMVWETAYNKSTGKASCDRLNVAGSGRTITLNGYGWVYLDGTDLPPSGTNFQLMTWSADARVSWTWFGWNSPYSGYNVIYLYSTGLVLPTS